MRIVRAVYEGNPLPTTTEPSRIEHIFPSLGEYRFLVKMPSEESVQISLPVEHGIKLHPNLESIRSATTKWLLRHELIDQSQVDAWEEHDIPLLAALTFPAKSEQACQIGADFIAWLFVTDDVFDRSPDYQSDVAKVSAVVERFFTILSEHIPSRGNAGISAFENHIRAFQDIVARIHEMQPTANLSHFFDQLKKSFAAIREITYWRKLGEAPSFSEYRRIRLSSSAVLPCLELDWVLEGGVGAFERNDGELANIANLAAWGCSIINDLASFKREAIEEKGRFTLLDSLKRDDIRYHESVLKAAQLYRDCVGEYELAVRAFCARFTSIHSDMPYLIEATNNQFAAQLAWHTLSARYDIDLAI